MDAEFVVSSLIEKLQNTSTIIHQCPMFDKQVQRAIKDLHSLKQCLKVAQHREASSGHSLNDRRMGRLLRAVYSAEDASDTLLTICTRDGFQIIKRGNGCKKMFQWPIITSWCKQILFTYEMKKLKHVLRDLSSYYHLLEKKAGVTSDIKDVCGNNINRLSFQNHEGQQQRWGRISDFCLKEETDVVGLEDHVNELVNLTSLIPFNKEYWFSKIIGVVGQAGSGKTTLVRTVYNRFIMEGSFTKRAWIQVAGVSKARDILANILKQIDETKLVVEATLSEQELLEELTTKLKHTRYLIVIEDFELVQVRKAISAFLLRSLPQGGIIIVTTCNPYVRYARSILYIRELNSEESWELFLKKVRTAEDVLNNNSNLIQLKEQILEVCGGLPLRIVLLGGLLSAKEARYDEWSRVIARAKGEDMFGLSYQDLPSLVKPCFLYMGLFPRDFEIPVRRLIHLWISEGFVTPLNSAVETLLTENLAEMYFEELVIRNMIQVRWRLDGTPKTCRMHGVLYDIFSQKAAYVGFFGHQLQYTTHASAKQAQLSSVRRLAACLGINNNFFRGINSSHLRSCLAFDNRAPGTPAGEIGMFLNNIISKRGFGVLNVLDLEGVYKPKLSEDAIEKLLLLRYLGLRSTGIDVLPSCVGNLPCLETLDVKNTIIFDLPTSVWKAKKLRHVYLNWSCSPGTLSSLLSTGPPTSLHTLWGLSISNGSELEFLKKLTGLRKLGLTCTSTIRARETAQWVSQLTQLHTLKLRLMRNKFDSVLVFIERQRHGNRSTMPTMAKHEKLQDLYLLGNLAKDSLSDVKFPPNLRILTLSQSEVTVDPMPVLGKLPHLNILRLFALSYRVDKIKCPSGGFPKLHVLKLWKVGQLRLRECKVEKGSMPCLRELEIRNCEGLREFTGQQYLTSLKELVLTNMPPDFLQDVPRSQLCRNLHVKRINY